mmetsp:Transcript_28951/g.72157  ORF Transcript_28951/g.72157 Transcript_28951/m.72157 type:complete len:95 (-) Transcript_28951:389-673(-)
MQSRQPLGCRIIDTTVEHSSPEAAEARHRQFERPREAKPIVALLQKGVHFLQCICGPLDQVLALQATHKQRDVQALQWDPAAVQVRMLANHIVL